MTSKPAKVIGRESDLGSLTIGREADITMLKIATIDKTEVEDNHGVKRELTKLIMPVGVWRAGKRYPISIQDQDLQSGQE